MIKFVAYLKTIKKLGFLNVFRVLIHRISIKSGYYKLIMPIKDCPFPEEIVLEKKRKIINFPEELNSSYTKNCLNAADKLINGEILLFSKEKYFYSNIPNWFLNCKLKNYKNIHWTEHKIFGSKDIKRCWELSRFSWAPLMARAGIISGNKKYIQTINKWIENWCKSNPINAGPNWICGQEVSIRLIHVMQTWKLIENKNYPTLTAGKINFVAEHLKRISYTLHYALAQQNNHWISESAALFIGGSWLSREKNQYLSSAKNWSRIGLKNLEESVNLLIMNDGSFSQHSTNYHRLVLDTLSQVELWRRWLGLKPFSNNFYSKFEAATNWLDKFVDNISGNVPNLGHNDGSFCYQLHCLSYRDFRPTLKVAQLLYPPKNGSSLSQNDYYESPIWLNLTDSKIEKIKNKNLEIFDSGGYVIIRPNNNQWGMLRLPTYNFRPAHADPLHFDLWSNGENILRDAGTFSYNSNPTDVNYFKGVEGHNTVQFDKKNPMIPLGNFLWGNWLKLETLEKFPNKKDSFSIAASYRFFSGKHHRSIEVSSCGKFWKIIDSVSFFRNECLIRWRLPPLNWEIDRFDIRSSLANLKVGSNKNIDKISLSSGYESLFYNQKESIPVLEILMKSSPVKVTLVVELF